MTDNDNAVVEQVLIKTGGSIIPTKMMDSLEQLEVESSFEMPDMFMMVFRDDEIDWMDQTTFDIGKSVTIDFAGSDGRFGTITTAEVTALEMRFDEKFDAYLIVRGYDKRHRLNRGKKAKAFVDSTDDDIAKKVGATTADATTGGTREHIFQDNQTDLAFLYQLGRLNGFEVMFDGTNVKFVKAGTSRSTINMEWGSTLRSFRPRMSIVGQVDEVEVRGWDPKTKEPIIGSARTSTVHPEIGLGGSGGTVAKKAIGAAKHIEVHRPVFSQGQATAIAQSILDEINSSFVEADGETDGNPNVLCGVTIDISNLGSKFSGKYLVTSVRHIYGVEGYYTEFSVMGSRPRLMTELAGVESLSTTAGERWTGVYVAIVTDNDDPEKMGRVKVKYPWFDDNLSSGWARVVMQGAGVHRGIQWLPEVNDEVLVGFEHGDMNYPYVLAGLYNGVDPVPETGAVASGKSEIRTFQTREGHYLKMTDQSGQQLIEIRDALLKNRLRMDPENEKIDVRTKGDIHLQSILSSESKTFLSDLRDGMGGLKQSYSGLSSANAFLNNAFGSSPVDDAMSGIDGASGSYSGLEDANSAITEELGLNATLPEGVTVPEPQPGSAPEGKLTAHAQNKFNMFASGNMIIAAVEATKFEAGGALKVSSGDDIVIVAVSSVTFKAPSITLSAGGNLYIKAGGNIIIKASGPVNLGGATVNLNTGSGVTFP